MLIRTWLAALALISVACTRTPVNTQCADSRLELAKEYLSKLKLDAAQAEADRALGCNPNSEEIHNLLGLVDYLRAVRNVQLLAVDSCLDGVDAEALSGERDDQLRAADRHFARAAELASDYSEAWSNRGSVALQLEEYDRAATYFTRALESPARLSDVGLTRAHLGWTHFLLGDYGKAAKELLQADQFNPGMCVANYRLGRIYFARQEWDKAARRFAMSVAASCRMQEAHLYLMRSQRAMGQLEQASATAAECVELAPNSCIAMACSGRNDRGDRVADR